MNKPQRWRGIPGSISGALIFVGIMALVILLASGCVHFAMLGAMTNIAQAHRMNKIEKTIEDRSAPPAPQAQR
tara:strand:+ start:359 stop:577 length:219 start_codon:yes stop_codon:yes gene_type:complete